MNVILYCRVVWCESIRDYRLFGVLYNSYCILPKKFTRKTLGLC